MDMQSAFEYESFVKVKLFIEMHVLKYKQKIDF